MNVIEKLIDPVSTILDKFVMARQMEDSKWFKQVGRRSKELQEMVIGVKK